MKQKYFYYTVPVVGTLFCLWYIFTATSDGIYSDYVRLVNSYLPDVFDPHLFFVPDILTRIPVNYLARIVNVVFFGYNIMFDRVLGVLALGLSAAFLTGYCVRKKLSYGWFLTLMVVLFSLNKWEMLNNGSGFAHFLSFALFYWHYDVLDRIWNGKEGKKRDQILMIALPFLTTLLVAGPYCAIYSVTMILSCVLMFFLKRKKLGISSVIYGGSVLVPFLFYLWSNHYAVEDHAAPATVPLMTQLMDTPGFFVRFFIKSFSSMVIEGERAEEIFHTNAPFLLLGLLVIGFYVLALWYNWRYHLYEETILPLMFLLSGGLNHVLIVLSRWIFLQENYGLSSRYALQFQSGILGILLTFALILRKRRYRLTSEIRLLAAAACVIFVAGNCYSTYSEIRKAPYRKNAYEQRKERSIRFEQETDEELRANFEYRLNREDSGQKVRSALEILKENGYSVFRTDDQ